MTEVFQLLGEIAHARSVNEVWALSTPYYRDLGFARVNYSFTRFMTDTTLGDPADALFLTTSSPEYLRVFTRDRFYARTPLFHWALHNVGACTWRWVHEALAAGDLTADQAETVRSNIAMGVVAGITISFPSAAPRSKGGLGLIGDTCLSHDDVDDIWANHGQPLLAVANMMHLKISQLPMATRRRNLTDRQRQALEWVADGKTTQDISQLMRISVAMVEKHLRLAREALEVDTTAQAVAKAALLNKIFHGSPLPADAKRPSPGLGGR
ncbi:helix-turn-helix transcriptional regulator [Rhodobacter ferrooxidans]|uniref:Transcriptional regulator, LuxR family n=1 Tax=Rhodobacter ferrooxidans TaxID=371731 RepID=C8RZ53_9RHOB|nr:LuxR family transcriptional regulator [Rhodobacter sp. SW2]EEW26010.1 transcriptional regulator, LuxR family [Rhodobacter sp. SW2]